MKNWFMRLFKHDYEEKQYKHRKSDLKKLDEEEQKVNVIVDQMLKAFNTANKEMMENGSVVPIYLTGSLFEIPVVSDKSDERSEALWRFVRFLKHCDYEVDCYIEGILVTPSKAHPTTKVVKVDYEKVK